MVMRTGDLALVTKNMMCRSEQREGLPIGDLIELCPGDPIIVIDQWKGLLVRLLSPQGPVWTQTIYAAYRSWPLLDR